MTTFESTSSLNLNNAFDCRSWLLATQGTGVAPAAPLCNSNSAKAQLLTTLVCFARNNSETILNFTIKLLSLSSYVQVCTTYKHNLLDT